MTRSEIRKRLRSRRNKGLCALVASRLGISRSAVTQWVSGKTQDSPRIKTALIEALAERERAHEKPEQQ